MVLCFATGRRKAPRDTAMIVDINAGSVSRDANFSIPMPHLCVFHRSGPNSRLDTFSVRLDATR
jgi:hypothetical protein